MPARLTNVVIFHRIPCCSEEETLAGLRLQRTIHFVVYILLSRQITKFYYSNQSVT